MYAIAHIIYGIPLASNNSDVEVSDVLDIIFEDQVDDQIPGFIAHYRGAGDIIPRAFGVQLYEFDECNHHIDLSTLTVVPTDLQKYKFDELFYKLPVELQLEINTKFGRPRVFLLWSSS